MKRVIIESPYGNVIDPEAPGGERRATLAEIEKNVAYLRNAMRDELDAGNAPFASRALYTQVYDDANAEQRRAGMEAGFAWGAVAEEVAVYSARGITSGMRAGIARAEELGIPVRFESAWEVVQRPVGFPKPRK